MEDLIEALNIFSEYYDDFYDGESPTHCRHDILYVGVDPEDVCDEDVDRLNELGFEPEEDMNMFYSWKFGSC